MDKSTPSKERQISVASAKHLSEERQVEVITERIGRERDEVAEKLKRELEKAEGQLDIILRECQGDDDASLANDYGGTGWEKEVPVATVRWHRNRWKKSNEVAEKLAEVVNTHYPTIAGRVIQLQEAGEEKAAAEWSEVATAFYAALTAYRERMGHEIEGRGKRE